MFWLSVGYLVLLWAIFVDKKKGIGYSVGEMFSSKPMHLLVLLVLIPGAVFTATYISRKNQENEVLAAADSLKKSAEEAAKRSEEQKKQAVTLKCIDRIDLLIKSANASIREKNATAAFFDLDACNGIMVSKEAIDLRSKAKSMHEADLARAAAANEANLKKQLLADKAQKKREGVRIGMSRQDVLDSAWGRPRDINRTTNTYGTHEQWVYDGGYLYFDGDTLTSIQN